MAKRKPKVKITQEIKDRIVENLELGIYLSNYIKNFQGNSLTHLIYINYQGKMWILPKI